jgi:hypothetical protein
MRLDDEFGVFCGWHIDLNLSIHYNIETQAIKLPLVRRADAL